MTNTSRQSSDDPPHDVDDRGRARASRVPAASARLLSRDTVIGLTLTVLIVAGIWVAAGAAWSAVAGESRSGASPAWPRIVYGAGSLTTALGLSRPGIMRIPRNLRRAELPADLRALSFLLLLLLQFVFGVLLPRVPGW